MKKHIPTHFRKALETKVMVAETFADTEKKDDYINAYYAIKRLIKDLGYNLETIRDLDKRMGN